MKRASGITIVMLVCQFFVKAQSAIESLPLRITYNKTTNLIFPVAIKAVDRGSSVLLVQQPKGVKNILKVKAGKPGFAESSLSVITADGKLYSFIVNYESSPQQLNYVLYKDSFAARSPLLFSSQQSDDIMLQETAEKIMRLKKHWHGVKDHNYKISLRLLGIYIDKDVLFFKLSVYNASTINYDVDRMRFFLRDKKKARRTATQEIEMIPIYAEGNDSKISRSTNEESVYALPKFTIPANKYMFIEMTEKNGSRQLSLQVKNNRLLKADTLE